MKMLLTLVLLALPAWSADNLNIPIERYKLPNGLRVVLSRDSAVPVLTVYVLYGVGARSEEKGRTGFAHLFEHMMFQGSANAPKGVHFNTVESNGGTLNGSTHPDYTDYFEIIPSNKLAVALWLEADRMRSLAITKENLANQKEAVKQERRLSFDNQPYNTAIVDVFPVLAFKNWSNSHSIIGSFDDLNAASVDDVGRFFRTHYAPNNAVLAIVGDLQVPETKKLIEQYFADIPAQTQAKSPDLTEPAQTEARWQTYKDPLARVPAMCIAYPGPKRRSPDYYALSMLDILFTTGESSRLYQSLVKERKSVLNAEGSLGWPFASTFDYIDPGVYGFNITYNPRFTSKQVIEQFEAEVAKLQTTLVDAKEMDRARATMRSIRVRSLQSTTTRASMLALYELFDGRPDYLNTELSSYLSITPQQIQNVAKTYLVKQRQSVLDIMPSPKEEKK